MKAPFTRGKPNAASQMTKTNSTERLAQDDDGLRRAAQIVAAGGLVAFPTETVYGLGADARNGKAVAAIYEAKGRPRFNPLIVHVPNLETAQRYGQFSGDALRLAAAFWPGPLSLVVPLTNGHGLSELVTAGLGTVALRVPAHPLAQAHLRTCLAPLAAPSANPSGRLSPTTADHVLNGLDGKIDAVLDGGPSVVGLESTIVAPGPPLQLLRAGGVPQEHIAELANRTFSPRDPGTITSPGQLAAHYAPHAPIRLNVTDPMSGEVHLGFGALDGDLNLSPKSDLAEAAANLFGYLHDLDEMGRCIAVAPIPMTGLGIAINDRLARAAAAKAK